MHTRYQGFPIISMAVVTVVVAILLSLSYWQFSRMLEKEQVLATVQSEGADPMRTLEQIGSNAKENEFAVVRAKGELDLRHIWLLDNQPFKGKIGYKVLAVANTNIGHVLVDYGWVAAPTSRNIYPIVPDMETELDQIGRVTIPKTNPFVDNSYIETKLAGEQTQYRVQGVDFDMIEKQSQRTLRRFLVTLTDPKKGLPRPFVIVNMGPEKHLAYAVQWLGLAIAALVIGVVVVRKRKSING